MESRCVARFIRIAPRKMRLVADLVRGLSVNEAIGLLKYTNRSAARPTLKAIQSAVANIVNREEHRDVNPDALFVKLIFVDEGPTFRRFLPRAMGRATPIRKRSSHLTVLVASPEAAAVETETAEAPTKTAVKAVKKTVRPAAAAKKSAVKRPVQKKKAE